MIKFTLYTSDYVGKLSNCIYPHKAVITNKESLIRAVSYDHVSAKYKDNYRSSTNYLSADNVPMDCDNDHSDNPKDWVTPKDVASAFSDVPFVVVYSRNHMKQKGDKAARPRFHVYFMTPSITDVKEYAELKQRIAIEFPYFDSNALDGARLIFGTPNPVVEIYGGHKSIMYYLIWVHRRANARRYTWIALPGLMTRYTACF